MTDDLAARAAALSALAAGLCQEAGLRLEVHDRGWTWDAVRRVIRVPEDDLRRFGAEAVAGRLVAEVGRYLLTRHRLFAVDFPSERALRALLDVLDLPRVERWMQDRFPGAERWLEAARPYRPAVDVALPRVVGFAVALAAEDALDPWSWAALHPDARQALADTAEARTLHARIAPSQLLHDAWDPALVARYRGEVVPALWQPGRLPGPREMRSRLAASDALDVAVDGVLPAAADLWSRDVETVAAFLAGHPGHPALAERALEDGDVASLIGRAFSQDRRPRPVALRLRELAAGLLEAFLAGKAPPPPVTVDPRLGLPREAPPGRVPDDLPRLQLPPPKRSAYEQAYGRVADQVESLVRRLEPLFRPRRRLRWSTGHPSGRRVDMARLMAFEADPRVGVRLWQRPTIPERRDTRLLLLVDLSGSMAGRKIEAAQLGTILLAETLDRLGLRFAVYGFQDVLVPLVPFGRGLGPDGRAALAAMPGEVYGSRPGGNNQPAYNDDGPCLLDAASRLESERGAVDRMLVVVSDGTPQGRRSDDQDLLRAVATLEGDPAGPELVALGLGPGTRHVERFYRQAEADVPIEAFAERIGGLVARVVLRDPAAPTLGPTRG